VLIRPGARSTARRAELLRERAAEPGVEMLPVGQLLREAIEARRRAKKRQEYALRCEQAAAAL